VTRLFFAACESPQWADFGIGDRNDCFRHPQPLEQRTSMPSRIAGKIRFFDAGRSNVARPMRRFSRKGGVAAG